MAKIYNIIIYINLGTQSQNIVTPIFKNVLDLL